MIRESLDRYIAHFLPSELFRRFSRNFTIGVNGAIASLTISLARTALMTKYLTLADFGNVAIVQNFFAFLQVFVGVGIGEVLMRHFHTLQHSKDQAGLRDLLWLSLGVSLALGVSISVASALLAGTIAADLYGNPDLEDAMMIYGFTAIATSVNNFTVAVLRLLDRFAVLHVWLVVGGIVGALGLFVYLVLIGGQDLTVVLAILAGGVFAGILPATADAFRHVHKYMFPHSPVPFGRALREKRTELGWLVFNTNLASYLKLPFPPGDIFVLGLLATPESVAVYALARQLVWPLNVLQNNLTSSLMPEAALLETRRNWLSLRRLHTRSLLVVEVLAGVALLSLLLFGREVILLVSTSEYLDAWPVSMVLALAGAAALLQAGTYPVGLVLDRLGLYNTALGVGVCAGAVVLLAAGADALSMGAAQLVAATVVAIAFVIPVARRLRVLSEAS